MQKAVLLFIIVFLFSYSNLIFFYQRIIIPRIYKEPLKLGYQKIVAG